MGMRTLCRAAAISESDLPSAFSFAAGFEIFGNDLATGKKDESLEICYLGTGG